MAGSTWATWEMQRGDVTEAPGALWIVLLHNYEGFFMKGFGVPTAGDNLKHHAKRA